MENDIKVEVGEDIVDIPKKDKFKLILNHLKTKVKDEEFDLSIYVAKKDMGNRNINNKVPVACIMGHAGNIAKFKELGYVIKNNHPYFNGLLDFKAICSFLEIPIVDALFLFNLSYYPNKTNTSLKEAIERLTAYTEKLS